MDNPEKSFVNGRPRKVNCKWTTQKSQRHLCSKCEICLKQTNLSDFESAERLSWEKQPVFKLFKDKTEICNLLSRILQRNIGDMKREI